MNLKLNYIKKFLDTNEMYEVIQEHLNEDEEVRHTIEDTNIEILAYHDRDLDIKWTVFLNNESVYDRVVTENLESTIRAIMLAP